MGSCLPINYLLVIENNEKCIICYEKVLLNKNYIKCNKCNILIHNKCLLKYKSNKIKDNPCPNCKDINSLFE